MEEFDDSPEETEADPQPVVEARPQLDRATLKAFATLDAKLLELVEILGGQQDRMVKLASKVAEQKQNG